MLTNRTCVVCGKQLQVGDMVTRVERIYRVGKVHTEATEVGDVAHLRCPK